ncbi:MAG: hypothetical protein ACQUYJ_20985 [Ferruginibacter sp.]
MKRYYYIGVLSVSSCSDNRNDNSIIYPEPKPDTVALKFLPGIVNSDTLDFNAAFSPDGKSFYFSRSHNRKYLMLETVFDGNNWSSPKPFLPVDTAFSNADPFITADGSMYFISEMPRNESDTVKDFDIWVIRKQGSKWSKPENIAAVNSDSIEYYVSVAANGNLYFSSNRSGGFGEHDIYVSKKVNGQYTRPVNLGPTINSAGTEQDPLIFPDESILISTIVNRTDGYGEADLYYSFKNSDSTFTKAKNMGSKINTPSFDYCPNYSPDLKYFFFSSDPEVKWIDLNYMKSKILGINR